MTRLRQKVLAKVRGLRHSDPWKVAVAVAWVGIAIALLGLYIVNERRNAADRQLIDEVRTAQAQQRHDFRLMFLFNCDASRESRRGVNENRETMRRILQISRDNQLARATTEEERQRIRRATAALLAQIAADLPDRNCLAELAAAEADRRLPPPPSTPRRR